MSRPHAAPVAAAPPAKFDADASSRSTPRASGEERLAMSLELMRTNALAGKARAEVLSLLGQGAYREPPGARTIGARSGRGASACCIQREDSCPRVNADQIRTSLYWRYG